MFRQVACNLKSSFVIALAQDDKNTKFLPDLMSRGGIAQLREIPHFQNEHQHLPSPCCFCINAHIINTLSLTFPNFFAVYTKYIINILVENFYNGN